MERLRVFLGVIDDDMQPELDAVINAINTTELENVRITLTVSRDQMSRAQLLDQLAQCIVYIGLYSYRFGSNVYGDDISAAEFEFNQARELRKPIFVWIRGLRAEEQELHDFARQTRFLREVRQSSTYIGNEFTHSDDLKRWVGDALRAIYLDWQLQKSLNFSEVLGQRLSDNSWAKAFPILTTITNRSAELVTWLSGEVQRTNDWRRVLLVARCWQASTAPENAEARAAVIDALLVGLATGISDERGRIAYRGLDPEVRRRSIQTLADLGEPAVERLIEALNEGHGIGAGAAEALGMIGDERAVEPLLAVLTNEKRPDTQRNAATALGELGDHRATAALLARLFDEDDDVRWAAAAALGKLGDRNAVEPLIKLLKRHRLAPDSIELKSLAAYALGLLRDPRAVDPLIQNLTHGSDQDVRSRAAGALGEIGDDAAVASLIDALSDQVGNVRWSAAVALGKIGSPAALLQLRVASEDKSYVVERAATEAILKIKRAKTQGKMTQLSEESPVKSLYKYVNPDRTDVLKGILIRFTQASCLNDTFELFPTMDSYFYPLITARLLEEMKATHRSNMLSVMDEHLGQQAYDFRLPAMVEDYLEDDTSDVVADMRRRIRSVIGMHPITSGEQRALISQTKEKINERFGVLSLAERADNLLMWSHYADAQRGFVIEFDTANSFFDQRKVFNDPIRRIRRVQYQARRPARRLFHEKYWLRSKQTAQEDLIEYMAALFLLTKSSEWAYEEEWRMILPLSQAHRVITESTEDIYLFSFPANCIRSVILGSKISEKTREEIVDTLKHPDLSHIELRQAHMDSNQFRVVIKDDESVLESTLLQDIAAFPADGIQERLRRLQVSGSRLYAAIASLTSKDLILSLPYDRVQQRKRILKLTDAGQRFLTTGMQKIAAGRS